MPKFILVHSKKPSQTREVHLNPEMQLNQECLIGRDPRCCLVLNDSLVSAQHGKICLRQGQYSFQDLGSRNGSRLNNETVKSGRSYLLNPSDVLQIGPFALLVQSEDETTTAQYDRPLSPGDYMPLATIEPTKIDRWTQGKLTVRCADVIVETDDTKTFVFVASPPRLFTYQPGQFVTLDLEIGGKRVMRSYSISSTPSR
ncbi:FHA domain-containing protein, partial [Oscillatoriales cyanobacterium LEGE 11467]